MIETTRKRRLLPNRERNCVPSNRGPTRRRPVLESLEDRIVPTVVDLTTVGSSGAINGALFQQGALYNGGSGNLASFVRITQKGTEFGYNTDARPYTDPTLVNGGTRTNPIYNHAIPLSEVSVVSVNGTAYLQFLLDINQLDSAALLSLDDVQISLAPSSTLQGYTSDGTYGGRASLIYDMHGDSNTWVKLNASLSSGSGEPDMVMDVPLSKLPKSAFRGPNRKFPLKSNVYVYLYSHFGDRKLNVGDSAGSANDGFEEWASPTVGTAMPTVSTLIYDAGTTPATPIVSPVPLGTKVKDAATVSGKSGTPTGSVTFLFYHTLDGTGPTIGAGTVLLNASGVARFSDIQGPLPVGAYSFVAHYNGDDDYQPATSAPEPFNVILAQPTLSTLQDPTNVTLDGSSPARLTDSAILAHGDNPTGTIMFQLLGPDGTTVVDTETVTVNGNGTYATPTGYTLPTSGAVAGTYQWVVRYTGDVNNGPASSTKGEEPVIVGLAGPSISTTPIPSDVTLDGGTSPVLKDSAKLASGYHPTGSITFSLFAPDGATIVDTETVAVSGNGTYVTPVGYPLPSTGTVTGTYHWLASYSGDPNNKPVTGYSGNEPVSVNRASPSISTTAQPAGVVLGTGSPPPLKDSATLAGGFGETGTITFTLFGPGGAVVDTETATVNGDGTYVTPTGYTVPATGAVTGTYQWVASYSGDANNNPISSVKGDEPVLVARARPTISTTTSPTEVTVGAGPLNDSATLAGGYNPTGTVTFNLVGPDGTTVLYVNHVTVAGNGVYSTAGGDNPGGFVPLLAGTYQWVVTYGGDANNASKTSVSGDEPVIGGPATPTLTTSASPSSITLDSAGSPVLKDSATLTGGVNPTGTITFTLFAPNGTTIVDTETIPVNGNGTYATPTGYTLPGTGSITGTYQWVASYSGDANNSPATSTKGDEPVAVKVASPSISTTPAPSDVALDNTGSPVLKDSAVLAGGYHETGTITFTLHSPGGTIVDTETVTVNGDGTYATPTGYTIPGSGSVVGTYQWVASYSGDANNDPVASNLGDEPVSVNLASPSISTSQDPSNVTLDNTGSPVLKDSATLTGSYGATGTLTFTLFGPTGALDVETVNVSGDGTYATPTGHTIPPAGENVAIYQWVVSYSGDANNNPLQTIEGDEPVFVTPATPLIHTKQNPRIITLDGGSSPILKDSAELTGSYNATGAIMFSLFGPGGGLAYTEAVGISGDGVYTTPKGYTLPGTATVAGVYQWVATYIGDENNFGAASAKGDEPVAVSMASPSLFTTPAPGSVKLDSGSSPILNDSATLSGGYNETGIVTFRLFSPTGNVVDTETAPVSGNGTYKTPKGYTVPTTGTVAGTYEWVASYSGDGNNKAVSSVKGEEPVAVDLASPSIRTTQLPSSITLNSNGAHVLKDSAVLSGGYHTHGTLTFRLFAPNGTTVLHTESVAVHGNGTYTTPKGYTLPASGAAVGTYQWVASYSGDGNNAPVSNIKGEEAIAVAAGPPVAAEELKRVGVHHQPTRIVLKFGGPLDPTTASDPANYRLVEVTASGARIPIALNAAIYDPSAHTVTLVPTRLLNVHRRYQLTISGVKSASGAPIAGNGGPGGSFVVTFGINSLRGINFTYSAAVPTPTLFGIPFPAARRALKALGG